MKVQGKIRKFKKVQILSSTQILICYPGAARRVQGSELRSGVGHPEEQDDDTEHDDTEYEDTDYGDTDSGVDTREGQDRAVSVSARSGVAGSGRRSARAYLGGGDCPWDARSRANGSHRGCIPGRGGRG